MTLTQLAREEGFDTLQDAFEAWASAGSMPGLCRACKEPTFDVEPDAAGYDCEECGAEGTVDSALVRAGLI